MARTINDMDLKEACVQAAREVIAEAGVEGLSLRDVARRLGISHQAPYRHFPSRDHLLAAVMQRCFADFSEHLNRCSAANSSDALHAMGEAYLAYATQKPLEYRLMFGTPWPEPAAHPQLVQHAVHAFDMLRNLLRHRHSDNPEGQARAEQEALFIWAALHGMTSIMQSHVVHHLALAPQVAQGAPAVMLEMIGLALQARSSAPRQALEEKWGDHGQ